LIIRFSFPIYRETEAVAFVVRLTWLPGIGLKFNLEFRDTYYGTS